MVVSKRPTAPLSVSDLAGTRSDRDAGDPDGSVGGHTTRPTTRSASTPERVDRLEIILHHLHLPKLADAGLVACDVEANTVMLVTSPAETETVSEVIATAGRVAARVGPFSRRRPILIIEA
jgi:hypothetical protein